MGPPLNEKNAQVGWTSQPARQLTHDSVLVSVLLDVGAGTGVVRSCLYHRQLPGGAGGVGGLGEGDGEGGGLGGAVWGWGTGGRREELVL